MCEEPFATVVSKQVSHCLTMSAMGRQKGQDFVKDQIVIGPLAVNEKQADVLGPCDLRIGDQGQQVFFASPGLAYLVGFRGAPKLLSQYGDGF